MILLLAEGIRQAGLSGQAFRVAFCLALIQVGLVAGFWRGLLELRFRRPMKVEAEKVGGRHAYSP